MIDKEYKSLWEVLDIIKNAFDDFIWYWTFLVEVEIKKVNKFKQFYYVDLVQIDNWKITESAKSNIFNPHIMTDFLSEAGIENSNNLEWKKVLLTLRPSFHKTYWFSFNIMKIHSEYFIWSLEKSKKESIEKLHQLWIFENNKKTNIWFPTFKVAVITWKDSEWYKDFQTIIDESWYKIECRVYPSLVHWEKAWSEVLKVLKEIDTSNYNLVAIMRWGWWSEGMNWTNDFELNKFVCNLNIPVMSAVWHTVDRSILDLVANYDCKTPSEAATILIDIYRWYDLEIERYTTFINKNIIWYFKEYEIVLSHLNDSIKIWIKWRFKNYKLQIESISKSINLNIWLTFKHIKLQLKSFESIINSNNPSKILNKGYSLVYSTNGKLVTEYEIWEKYLMSSKDYNYKINIEEKEKK